MNRWSSVAAFVAAFGCLLGAASATSAADHREAPALQVETRSSPAGSALPGATNTNQPQEHDVIEEWRKRFHARPRRPLVRPPSGNTLTPNLN